MSVPGRDNQAPLGGSYGTRPGNGVPRSVFEPAAGLDAGALGPGGLGADGAGRDPRLGRAGALPMLTACSRSNEATVVLKVRAPRYRRDMRPDSGRARGRRGTAPLMMTGPR